MQTNNNESDQRKSKLENGQKELAQLSKEKLENIQRGDRKLREKFSSKTH